MAFTSAVNTVHFLLKFIKCKTPIQKSPPIHTRILPTLTAANHSARISLSSQQFPRHKGHLNPRSLQPLSLPVLPQPYTTCTQSKQAQTNPYDIYLSHARAQSFSWWNSHSRVLYTHTIHVYACEKKKSTRAEREPSSASPARELLLEIYSNIFN